MSPITSVDAGFAVQEATSNRLSTDSLDHADKSKLKSTFQDVVAGTFYKEMLKSLRKMHDKPAYFHGGQAEQIFQGQLDQQVAEDLAHDRGSQFADSLYQSFLQHSRL